MRKIGKTTAAVLVALIVMHLLYLLAICTWSSYEFYEPMRDIIFLSLLVLNALIKTSSKPMNTRPWYHHRFVDRDIRGMSGPTKFNTLQKIVDQLEFCKFKSEAGEMKNNLAFLNLKEMAKAESLAGTVAEQVSKTIKSAVQNASID